MPAARPILPSQDSWLPLGAASRIVGVDPDTLRRWADEGRVRAYATPGGHRRFRRGDLDRLISSRQVGSPGALTALGATPARLSAAYRRGYARTGGPGPLVRLAVPGGEREAYRAEGRRLIALLLEHLDTGEPEVRARTARTAGTVAEDLGRRLAQGGVPLDDAVRQFVAARRPFLAQIATLARRRALSSDRVADVYDRATSLLDDLLVRFVDAHGEAARSSARERTAPTAR
ncbi:MAG TPA: helix-turn-helix domain-containing protein [Candidatus Limnocylindrales bacterium]|nr:helix-turn-helix domain-containing protein [Candidatus Limnocylindrales bacterium]